MKRERKEQIGGWLDQVTSTDTRFQRTVRQLLKSPPKPHAAKDKGEGAKKLPTTFQSEPADR